jgi:hypothetical protein
MDRVELEPKVIAERLRRIDVSGPYAWQIAHGKRAPSRKLAVRIWREAGIKLGPLVGKSDDEIQIFAKFVEVSG